VRGQVPDRPPQGISRCLGEPEYASSALRLVPRTARRSIISAQNAIAPSAIYPGEDTHAGRRTFGRSDGTFSAEHDAPPAQLAADPGPRARGGGGLWGVLVVVWGCVVVGAKGGGCGWFFFGGGVVCWFFFVWFWLVFIAHAMRVFPPLPLIHSSSAPICPLRVLPAGADFSFVPRRSSRR